MHFVYALINFLLLIGLILLFGRKMIVSIFKTRRERIDRELSEAEAIEGTVVSMPEPVLPELNHTGDADELALISHQNRAALQALEDETREKCLELRREMILRNRQALIDSILDQIQVLLAQPEYAQRLRAQEQRQIQDILNRIRLTPGDMMYLRTHDVLYVTLTSSHPLDQELVDQVDKQTSDLLSSVGGKTSFWVKVEPEMQGGLRLRIGDTVYDCTVADGLYTIRRRLEREVVRGDEDAETLLQGCLSEIQNMPLDAEEFQLGRAISVSDGICWLYGLADIMYGEVVEFECGEKGMVLDIQSDRIGCIVYGRYDHIESGSRVRRVGRIASVPAGEALLGRVVDPMGHPLDGKGRIWATEHRPIECASPSIPDRSTVNRPLHTGIKAIDSMVPIGRGQRELIIGDRQTGKSSLAVDAIINQKGKDVICIYVAIGQKDTTVADIQEKLTKHGAMDYTTIVCAPASYSASLQYIAPFAGAAMGEYFMYHGKDVLIVYDDLSKHAVAYREISLLLHRPSGREAYPGDVFYLHSRLLERAAQLSEKLGGGSMTALPIIETQAGDISAYIPTNVISITDGQIFLESDLFNEGQRPAINVGLSVSRVGSAAQTKLMKQVSGRLRMNLAQYRELASFSQFGSDLDASTKQVLESGARMMAALRQGRFQPLPDWKQALLIYAVSEGFADHVIPDQMEEYEEQLYRFMEEKHKDLVVQLETGNKLQGETLEQVRQALSQLKCG